MYGDFAEYYDLLTGDVDYKRRTEYLCQLFEEFDRLPSLALDLACGTGGFSNELAERGIQVIGVDLSPEMLCRARENSLERNLEVLYLCQDACELDLYGTVDGAICCLDSLNHITDYEMLCRAVARVSLFLEKDRLFIFDVNTLYKHETVLGNNTFVLDENGVYCVWSNEYNADNLLTEIALDFFSEQADGRYMRSGDSISERAYTPTELENAVKGCGLEILAVYGEFTRKPPEAETQRAVYITRKVR